MRFLVRTLLVLAALAYGAMPLTGMAGVPSAPAAFAAAAMATEAETGAAPTTAAHGHAMHGKGLMAASSTHGANSDCPHPGKSDRSPHCAACLTLPAALPMADGGKPPRSAEAVTVLATLTSWPAAPLDPPPRV